jgi:hypothetical protein
MSIRFAKGTPVRALGLPGLPLQLPKNGEPEKATLRCSGRTCDGLQVEVLLGSTAPVRAELFATRFALPAEGRPLAAARPANAHPQYAPDSSIRRRLVAF